MEDSFADGVLCSAEFVSLLVERTVVLEIEIVLASLDAVCGVEVAADETFVLVKVLDMPLELEVDSDVEGLCPLFEGLVVNG